MRGLLTVSLLGILVTGTLFAHKAASDRIARTKAETKSFRVERDAFPIPAPTTRR